LTPSSTVPRTRLVIIWLKRWLATPLIDDPLEFAPVGVGLGDGDGSDVGDGVRDGELVGDGSQLQSPSADAGPICIGISTNQVAAISAADTTRLRENPAIVSARTACLWD